MMKSQIPYWQEGADYSRYPFFIRRMDTTGFSKAAEVPLASLPMVGFLYLADGEVLVEIEARNYLCSSGHLLLIPEGVPFAIPYYRDAVGFSGGFSPRILAESKILPRLVEPVQQAFWFDEGAFVGELFNMLTLSFEKDDQPFIGKALDLLLSRIRFFSVPSLPPPVSRFLDLVFDGDRIPSTASDYAARLGLSRNYLNRLVKHATGTSAGEWIDHARLNRAKRLLRDTQLPVIDIAAAAGLDDQSYFARFFKRHTGMTPSAFRLQSRKMHGKS